MSDILPVCLQDIMYCRKSELRKSEISYFINVTKRLEVGTGPVSSLFKVKRIEESFCDTSV